MKNNYMLLAMVAIIFIIIYLGLFYKKEHFIDEQRLIVRGRDIMAELDNIRAMSDPNNPNSLINPNNPRSPFVRLDKTYELRDSAGHCLDAGANGQPCDWNNNFRRFKFAPTPYQN